MHNWTSNGYIVPETRPEAKQGFPLRYSPDEAAVVMSMAALVGAGLSPQVATRLARYMHAHRVWTIRVTPHVVITLETSWSGS